MPVLSYSGRTYDIQRPCQACLACRVVSAAEEVQLPCKLAMPRLSMVFEKGRIALQAGHASPVKWCLNEKVELLCKLAMPVKWCLNEKVEFRLQNDV